MNLLFGNVVALTDDRIDSCPCRKGLEDMLAMLPCDATLVIFMLFGSSSLETSIICGVPRLKKLRADKFPHLVFVNEILDSA